jgi:hypothetical protein
VGKGQPYTNEEVALGVAMANNVVAPWPVAFNAAMMENQRARVEKRRPQLLPKVRVQGPVPANQFIMMLGAFAGFEVVKAAAPAADGAPEEGSTCST